MNNLTQWSFFLFWWWSIVVLVVNMISCIRLLLLWMCRPYRTIQYRSFVHKACRQDVEKARTYTVHTIGGQFLQRRYRYVHTSFTHINIFKIRKCIRVLLLVLFHKCIHFNLFSGYFFQEKWHCNGPTFIWRLARTFFPQAKFGRLAVPWVYQEIGRHREHRIATETHAIRRHWSWWPIFNWGQGRKEGRV